MDSEPTFFLTATPVTSRRKGARIHLRITADGFSYRPTSGLARHFHSPVHHYDRVPPSSTPMHWYRNINRLSIDYAFRPRLRLRLTLGGITFPRKP
jgi:hypothetical protein